MRRRRECTGCGRRFTTFEEPERPRLFVVKRGGSREEFDREKLMHSLVVACRRRPVSVPEMRQAAERVERHLFDLCVPEVPSRTVGDRVMRELFAIDPVAFVRFASVYQDFSSLDEFTSLVERVRAAQVHGTSVDRVLDPHNRLLLG